MFAIEQIEQIDCLALTRVGYYVLSATTINVLPYICRKPFNSIFGIIIMF